MGGSSDIDPIDSPLSSPRSKGTTSRTYKAKGSKARGKASVSSTAPVSRGRQQKPTKKKQSESRSRKRKSADSPELTDGPAPKFQKTRASLSQAGSSLNQAIWRISNLGRWVWVLVDRHGAVLDSTVEPPTERYWWPAKVKNSSSGKPFTVSLYGQITPTLSSNTVEIKNPSESNILSIFNPNTKGPRFISFKSATVNDSIASAQYTSPRKKRKLKAASPDYDQGLSALWMVARDDIKRDMQFDEDEEFLDPLYMSELWVPEGSWEQTDAKADTVEKETEPDDDQIVEIKERWSPPPADDSLKIPGELVYSLSVKEKNDVYWPANIRDYIPPTKPDGQKKIRKKAASKDQPDALNGPYWVEFLDGHEEGVPRNWFYTDSEDGFATCIVGKFESKVQDIHNDDEGVEEELERRRIRESSPDEPLVSLSAAEFSDQPLRVQFSFTKPVLRAVMNARHAPTLKTHNDFIAGRNKRRAVVENAAQRGLMDPVEVSEVRFWIHHWCMRNEGSTSTASEESQDGANEQEFRAVSPIRTEPAMDSSPAPSPPPPSMPPSSFVVYDNTEMQSTTHVDQYPEPLKDASSTTAAFNTSTTTHDTESQSKHMDRNDLPMLKVSEIHREADPLDSPLTPLLDNMDDDIIDIDAENGIENAPLLESQLRQYGCEAYEGLTSLEKADYGVNVLLPECLLQILLWRSGERSSIKPMSDEEERRLHEIGEKKLKESDWVPSVEQLRAVKRRSMKLDDVAKKPAGATRSRPGTNKAR